MMAPPAVYAQQLMQALGVPPNSPSSSFYLQLITVIQTMIQQATVTTVVTGVAAVTSAPGSAPVTGTGVGNVT